MFKNYSSLTQPSKCYILHITRMHSNRMRTSRSLTVCQSLLLGEGGHSISPLGVGLDLIPLNFPLGCGPGPDPPQFPPWVWAWRGVPPSWGVSLEGVPPSWGGCLLGGKCLLLGRGGGSPWQGGWYPSMH